MCNSIISTVQHRAARRGEKKMSKQNDIEHLQDLIHLGEISADDANVQMVRNERFRLITGKCPQVVRKALNSAVKSGVLGHKKKDGHKPECYYHHNFEFMANEARRKHEEYVINAVSRLNYLGK